MLQKTQTLLLKEPFLENAEEILIESCGYKFKCKFDIIEEKVYDEFDVYENLEKEKFNLIQIENIQFENFVIPLSNRMVYMMVRNRTINNKLYYYKINLRDIKEENNDNGSWYKENSINK